MGSASQERMLVPESSRWWPATYLMSLESVDGGLSKWFFLVDLSSFFLAYKRHQILCWHVFELIIARSCNFYQISRPHRCKQYGRKVIWPNRWSSPRRIREKIQPCADNDNPDQERTETSDLMMHPMREEDMMSMNTWKQQIGKILQSRMDKGVVSG